MNLINRMTELTQNLMDTGKGRVETFRNDRRRNELLQELGALTHRRHGGDAIDDAAIDSILAALDRLAATESDEEAAEQSEEDSAEQTS